jgi:hypothetical protein
MKSKTQILVLILVLNMSFTAFSQTYSWISSYYYSYIEISIEYTRTSAQKTYSYGSTLATKQAQYDAARREINAVYGQMTKLQLLNKINRGRLNAYRDKYFKEIANDASKLDLSDDYYKNWAIKAFRTPVTDDKNIRNEIKVLNRIGNEISLLEGDSGKLSEDQTGKTDEKKNNIRDFLTEFENSDPSLIQTLLKKHKLDLIMFGDFLE